MKHKIIKPHKVSYDYHLELKKDDELLYEKKPTDFAGWLWCTTKYKRSCWIPESYLRLIDESKCYLKNNYSSKELNVNINEEVKIKFIESGWAWIAKSNNEIGWIPVQCINLK